MSDQTAIRVRIYGRVQGVWYRGWTAERAKSLGLTGWVRNRRDGSVEALFFGKRSAIDEMLQACGSGPAQARVDDIATEPAQGIVADRFDVKPTV